MGTDGAAEAALAVSTEMKQPPETASAPVVLQDGTIVDGNLNIDLLGPGIAIAMAIYTHTTTHTWQDQLQ